jgi:hypothetical protein
MAKLINTDKLDRLSKALDNRIKVTAEELTSLIDDVREMLGGRALVYLTQLEYDSLSEAEQTDESKSYFITDAEDLSHKHENKEFLDSLSQTTIDDINNEIDVVEGMLGGKSLVYVTQAEYDALTDDEKLGESVLYIITDMEDVQHEHENKAFLDSLEEGNIDANTVNGYSVWIGTTAELEAIEEKDANTIYFEIDEEETYGENVVQVDIVDGVLNLTTDKYQKANVVDGTEIVFPVVTGFTEIHLYFNSNDNMNLVFPNCKWRVNPNIEAGNSYEIIAVYNTMNWLVNCITYS